VTFDVEDVRKLATEMTSRLDACDNGEGMECATLDQSLGHYARTCCDFLKNVREWGRNVFAGNLASDPQVEREWLDDGRQLYDRALGMWQRAARAEAPCDDLPGHRALQASLWQLHRLLTEWVSPKLSVGPAARNPLSPEVVAEAERRIAELQPLPEDWDPVDSTQRSLYRKAQAS
jgi:hypothetical protein